MMEMRQEANLVQMQRCLLCNNPINKHQEDCIEQRGIDMENEFEFWPCPLPDCKPGPKDFSKKVMVNAEGFYECRKCHTKFSRFSDRFARHDPDLERTYIVDETHLKPCFTGQGTRLSSPRYDAIKVGILPKKGEGDFPRWKQYLGLRMVIEHRRSAKVVQLGLQDEKKRWEGKHDR